MPSSPYLEALIQVSRYYPRDTIDKTTHGGMHFIVRFHNQSSSLSRRRRLSNVQKVWIVHQKLDLQASTKALMLNYQDKSQSKINLWNYKKLVLTSSKLCFLERSKKFFANKKLFSFVIFFTLRRLDTNLSVCKSISLSLQKVAKRFQKLPK